MVQRPVTDTTTTKAATLPCQRVLVTGGAGFIGSFLVDRLARDGHEVRVLDNLEPQVHPGGVPLHGNSAAEFIRADVRDRGAMVAALDGVDTVFHCAAAVGVAQSLYRVEHYVDVNVHGIATLLDVLIAERRLDVKVVLPTSMTGYGEGLYRRPSDNGRVRPPIRTDRDIAVHGWEPVCHETGEALEPIPTPEDASFRAQNIYALTKRYQEELCLSVAGTYGLPVTCLRLFNVYGPRQSLSNPYTGVLAIFLSRLRNGAPPVVYEDGSQTRDFVSVHDVVRAMLLAASDRRAGGRVYNVGSGQPRSIGDCARTLAASIGRSDLQPEISGRFRFGDIRHCTAAIDRIRQELGFEPRVTWEDGLAELVAWSATETPTDLFAEAEAELQSHGIVRSHGGS